MLSGRPKRPSSARRNIKQELFSPFVSGGRLRNVQALLWDGEDVKTPDDKSDAILCISGIDSRYNDGTTELINYLLFGFFDVRKDELDKSGFAEEILDDIIFLIQRDQVDIYCNPINYHFLLPYTSHWRNVRYHCLTEEEYEKDEEEAEEFKIHTFISLVEHCQTIGIPYSNSVNLQSFDKMVVEKWPIIQAYGLDEYGGGGFFTMKHKLTDMSKSLHSIYSLMDLVTLETLVTEHLVLFQRQWQTLVTTVDVEVGNGDLTEKKVCEPLTSYYLHGRVGTCNTNQNSDDNRKPYVYFGMNSKKIGTQSESGTDDILSTGLGGKPAKYMVCQAVTPKGPLSCSRTYFFNEFRQPFEEVPPVSTDRECRLLIELYDLMVDCVLDGIRTFAATQSVKTTEVRLKEELSRKCLDLEEPSLTKHLKHGNNIEFSIRAVDYCGCSHPVTEGQWIPHVKVASLTLHNIPSVSTNTPIGSLVFAESFLDSVIQTKNQDGSKSSRSEVLVLTSEIPRFLSWAVTGMKKSERDLLLLKMKDKKSHDKFGDALMSGELVRVGCLKTLCSPLLEEHLFVYMNALVIFQPQSGGFVLQGSDIELVQFYHGDSTSVVAVLLLKYKADCTSMIPLHLQSQSRTIIITAPPKSRAYKQFFAEVLPLWKTDSSFPPVEKLSDLPDCYTNLYRTLQHKHQYCTSLQTHSLLKKSAGVLQHFDRFLTHFLVSSVSQHVVSDQVFPILLDTAEPGVNAIDKEKLVVTVLSGVPGSHQDLVCQALTSLSKEQNRWTILKQPIGSAETFSPRILQHSLSAACNIHRRPKLTSASRRKCRILLIVQNNTDIVEVVHTIQSHPDPEVRAYIKIGAVTACVDPLNSFLQDRLTYPLLLNHCAQGWVNNILFTTSTSIQDPVLKPIQELLRSVNSDVSFMLAENGQVTRSSDIDAILSETAFYQPEKVKARHLLYPGWSEGCMKKLSQRLLMQNISLKFTQPLEKGKLLNKLRGLKKNLAKFPLSENIYHVCGKIQFTESEQMMELEYVTLSGSLKLKPSEIQPVPPSEVNGTGLHGLQNSSIAFSGYHLKEATLKDWLRGCAKQVPEKKKQISRKDLKPEEIKKIHEKRHLETLPPGWFYNGTHYISFSGDKQTTHPGIEDFVLDYLKEKNKEIDTHNAKVDLEAKDFIDLFA